MKWLSNFLLWLWQFPQNYIAFLVYSCLGYLYYYGKEYYGRHVIYSNYIVALPNSTDKSLKHELGHSYQSQLLGWLYIPVIVIPSVLHNLYCGIVRKMGYRPNYYSFYTEKWADKLVEKVG